MLWSGIGRTRTLLADGRIAANLGQAAYQYGPLVYCYEVDAAAREHTVDGVHARLGAQPMVTWVEGVPWLRTELIDIARPAQAYYTYDKCQVKSFQALLPPFYLHSNCAQDTHWTTWLPLL